MKKQIKKLNLNKRTISNLNIVEMNLKAGGNMPGPTRKGLGCTGTCHGHTCNGNNTCV